MVLVFLAGSIAGIGYDRSRQTLDLTTFWQVYQKIQDQYVGGAVDDKKAVEGATKGLVESLNDPYSSFLPASDKKSLDEELSGQFEGIGAELTEKDGVVVIVAPIAGSPAEKAGLKAKDIILSVDGQLVDGKTLDEAVNLIRGAKGTAVKLVISRPGRDEPMEFSLVRDEIQVKSVTSKMIGNVGYIAISQFGDDTVYLAQQAVKELKASNPKGVIIDLRNNPGGYLNDVAPIAGLFIAPSVVVQEKDRAGHIEQLKSTAVPVMPDVPLYVLVNDGSASAAEILAGAFQDYGRAKLVGAKTFGKGSVQDIISLPNDTALRLTIAEWLTPKGRQISKVGIEPDIAVADNKTDTSDPVLDKALSLAK
jgi:carboxyl-terminal processing protease